MGGGDLSADWLRWHDHVDRVNIGDMPRKSPDEPGVAGSSGEAPTNEGKGRRMIVELFHGVRWVDVMIHRKLGFAYQALLGAGLVVEIVRHLHEARDLDSTV
jgi:hypothetical protein